MNYTDFQNFNDFKQNEKYLTKETETQTSKTVLELVAFELQKLSLKSPKLQNSPKKSPINNEENIKLEKEKTELEENKCEEIYNRKEFLTKTPTKYIKQSPNTVGKSPKNSLTLPPVEDERNKILSLPNLGRYTIKKIRVRTVRMDSDREENSEDEELYKNLKFVPKSPKTPPKPEKVLSKSSSETEYSVKDDINHLITRIKCDDWNTALSALEEITHLTETCPVETIFPFMPEINQRLIHLLQSPRSHVTRTSCQLAGTLFRTVSDVRRPEFDDIVDLLFARTADLNRFIKNDANIALDQMVSSVSPFHAVRSICNKGTRHKNDSVRIAAARLFVNLITTCESNLILGHGGNEFTRKRVLTNMVSFLNDKNAQVRHYGEELRKILKQHENYQFYFKKTIGGKSVKNENRNTV